MEMIHNGYRGLSLIVYLNRDSLFSVGTIVVGLLAGAFLGQAVLAALQVPAGF